MLIPKNHPMTATIIRCLHAYSLHGGTDLVLNLIRTKFCIPEERSTVTKENTKFSYMSSSLGETPLQIMRKSPPSRVNPCRAFKKVGVAFDRPITTKCAYK